MKQLWLWLGAIALGVGFLGLVFGSLFDLTGQAVSGGNRCISDSLYKNANGVTVQCPDGYRCVPDKGMCGEVGGWACLDSGRKVFISDAGSPSDFKVQRCSTGNVCVSNVAEGARCEPGTLVKKYPGRYLGYIWR